MLTCSTSAVLSEVGRTAKLKTFPAADAWLSTSAAEEGCVNNLPWPTLVRNVEDPSLPLSSWGKLSDKLKVATKGEDYHIQTWEQLAWHVTNKPGSGSSVLLICDPTAAYGEAMIAALKMQMKDGLWDPVANRLFYFGFERSVDMMKLAIRRREIVIKELLADGTMKMHGVTAKTPEYWKDQQSDRGATIVSKVQKELKFVTLSPDFKQVRHISFEEFCKMSGLALADPELKEKFDALVSLLEVSCPVNVAAFAKQSPGSSVKTRPRQSPYTSSTRSEDMSWEAVFDEGKPSPKALRVLTNRFNYSACLG